MDKRFFSKLSIYEQSMAKGKKTAATQTAQLRKKVASMVALSKNPQPLSKTVNLRYAQYFQLAAGGAGAPSKYTFRANSIFDPSETGVGHQPMFHDLYASLYNHYVVKSSKFYAKLWSETSGTTYNTLVCVKLDDDNSLSMNAETLLEQRDPLVKWKLLRQQGAGTHDECTIHHSFNAKSFFGLKDPEDNETVGAQCGANPTDQAYYIIQWQHSNASTVLNPLHGLVFIDYEVEFAEPKDQASN